LNGKGAYIRSTPDNTDIDLIYDNISKMMARNVGSDIRFSRVNRYQWPLAAAILCFAAEGVWIAVMPWLRAWRMRRDAIKKTGNGAGARGGSHA
jgi:hypothetical protein